jgi:hypothetical protein
MLMLFLLPGLPAGLGDTGDVAIESQFADLGASQTELTEGATRATGDFATVALTRRVGVARQLLQRQACSSALFFALLQVVAKPPSVPHASQRTWQPACRA